MAVDTQRPKSMVTGASRGIGKAVAVHLARAGYDVALTARTQVAGEAREHSSTLKKSDSRPLPGSLAETAQLVNEAGGEAFVVPADLLDLESVAAAARAVQDAWGCVDVLVNNGRYVGPGHMDELVDTPVQLIQDHFTANVMAPLTLIKAFIPCMVRDGGGTVVNITSGAGYADPPAKVGSGGWGLGYGMSKGALHRAAGILALELGDRGLHFFNVQPGFIATERMAMDMADFGFDPSTGAPPDVVGAVVAWIATDPAAAGPNGRNLEAQDECRARSLLPGWG
jgi:NAD(P)-dependent dehydrogenase (short-subunit alcohol dehydrogenase family)